MSLDERLKQAKSDREAIDNNIKEIEKQIEEEKFPNYISTSQVWEYHGDVVLINSIGYLYIANDINGDYWGSIANVPLASDRLLKVLKKMGAKYLGSRNEVFTVTRIDKEN